MLMKMPHTKREVTNHLFIYHGLPIGDAQGRISLHNAVMAHKAEHIKWRTRDGDMMPNHTHRPFER